jgi:hypothetical protein
VGNISRARVVCGYCCACCPLARESGKLAHGRLVWFGIGKLSHVQ